MFLRLSAVLFAICQSTSALANADVCDRSLWKSVGDKKSLEYASLRDSVAHFNTAYFPKHNLMLKYCSNWSSEGTRTFSQDNSEFLLRFDRGVAGGLSVKPLDKNSDTVEKCGKQLISNFKKGLETNGGHALTAKVTAKDWQGLKALRFERTFSYPDVAEQISCVSQLWLKDGRQYCIEIAAPDSWFKNKIYGKMIGVSIDSVSPIDPYIYQRDSRVVADSSIQKIDSKNRVNDASAAINVDEIMANLKMHYDEERELQLMCPKDAVWQRRYDKIKFLTRNVPAFEYKKDLYQINLTSSWQYLGQTLDSMVGEIKRDLPDCRWETISRADVTISGLPGKKLVLRIQSDPQKPVEVQTVYVLLANSLFYKLEMIAPESMHEKMSKVIDTMATSMKIK